MSKKYESIEEELNDAVRCELCCEIEEECVCFQVPPSHCKHECKHNGDCNEYRVAYDCTNCPFDVD